MACCAVSLLSLIIASLAYAFHATSCHPTLLKTQMSPVRFTLPDIWPQWKTVDFSSVYLSMEVRSQNLLEEAKLQVGESQLGKSG